MRLILNVHRFDEKHINSHINDSLNTNMCKLACLICTVEISNHVNLRELQSKTKRVGFPEIGTVLELKESLNIKTCISNWKFIALFRRFRSGFVAAKI